MMTFSIAVVRSSLAAMWISKVLSARAALPRGPLRSRVLNLGKGDQEDLDGLGRECIVKDREAENETLLNEEL